MERGESSSLIEVRKRIEEKQLQWRQEEEQRKRQQEQRKREEELQWRQEEEQRKMKQDEDMATMIHDLQLHELLANNTVGVREAFRRLYQQTWDSLPAEVREMQNAPEETSELAFRSEFQGDGTKRFYSALNNVHLNEQFARVAGLFQSSGWGKSRLVTELHREGVWVVYMSLGTGSCFPRKASFAEGFEATLRQRLGFGGLAGEIRCMNYCLAYWIACVQVLASIVKPEPRMDPGENPAEPMIPERFVKMMIDGGGKFWADVEEKMKSVLESFTDGKFQDPPKEDQEIRSKILDSWDNAAASLYNASATESLTVLGASMEELKLVFVIDEARHLLPLQGGKISHEVATSRQLANVYTCLRRSTMALKSSLVLFLDTMSKVGNFIGPEWKYPSARNQKPSCGLFLAPPLAGFFEASIGSKWDGGEVTLKVVASEDAMVRFGRPLWWSLYQAGGSTPGAFSAVKALAMVKLTGHGTPDKIDSDEELIAIVGNRSPIHVDASAKLVTDLVASHAMTVVGISADRSRLFAAWPEEPLLSEVAFDAMQRIKDTPSKGYRFLLEPVQRKLAEGILDVGEMGEWVTMIVFIEAIDNVRARTKRAWITVRELLEELFTEETVTGIIRSAAAAGQKEKLEKLLGGKVLVNAFRRVHKPLSDISSADAKLAMETRCGIVAAKNTMGTDFLIPVHLGDESALLDPTTGIVLQTKVLLGPSGLIDLAKVSPEYSGMRCFGSGVPYLSLFVNLEPRLVGKKAEFVNSFDVWESVACSKEGVIKGAREALEADGSLLRRWKAAGPSDKKKTQKKLAELEGQNPRKRKRVEEVQDDIEERIGIAGKRWRNWMQADWRNQIIVRAVGLESLNLNAVLRECLINIAQTQRTMRPVRSCTLSPVEVQRFELMENNSKLEVFDKMFRLGNISQLLAR